MTYKQIVAEYIRDYRDRACQEMRFFETQRNASDAIRSAAFCALDSGKRHPHQYRIPRAVLEAAELRLQVARKKLAAASDFTALHEIVEREIGTIKGIGALTVYDISHRLGAFFKKTPTLVYLHAGTRGGAAILGFKGTALDPARMPAPFSRLTAAEIEDCLCIYKNRLLGGERPKHRRSNC